MSKSLNLSILPQPDNTSCGPTCLHAVYDYYEDKIELSTLIKEVSQFEKGGGTLAVILALHALKRGYSAKLHSYNLNIFDPTWKKLSSEELISKLKQQLKAKTYNRKFKVATKAYIQFLELGGEIILKTLSPKIIRNYLHEEKPILTGLSATYLYQSVREHPETNKDSDIAGSPVGHFVVVHGMSNENKEIQVADPYLPNPISGNNYYSVTVSRLIASILLGVMTYDGNLLILSPKR